MATVATLTIDVVANTARFASGLGKTEKEARRFASRVKRNMQVAATATGLFGTALVGLTKQATDAARGIADASDKIGVSAESLQELRFAAEQVGVGQRTLDTALQRFSRRVGEAANGSGELKDTLQRLGVAVRDVNGNVRSVDAVFSDYAGAVAGLGSEQEQLAATFKAVDSEGAQLVNLFRGGAVEVERYREQARALGLVLSNDLVQKGAEASKQFNIFANVLKTQVQVAILDNIESVQQFAEAAIKAAKTVTNAFVRAGQSIGKAFGFLAAAFSGGDLTQLIGLLGDDSVGGGGGGGGASSRRALEGFGLPGLLGVEGKGSSVGAFDDGSTGPTRNPFAGAGPIQAGRDPFQDTTRGIRKVRKEAKETRTAMQDLGFTFTSAFEEAVLGAEKLGDVLKALGRDIIRIFLRRTVTERLGGLFEPDGFLGGLFGGFFGGNRAAGGTIQPGRSYLVGERGPEMVTAGFAGTVSPYSGGVVVNNTIDARGADATLRRALPGILEQSSRQTEARLIERLRRGRV